MDKTLVAVEIQEFEDRQKIFEARAEEVRVLNSRPRRWIAGLGPLDFSEEELQALRGWRGVASPAADDGSSLVQVRVRSLPEQFNWTSLASLSDVVNQGGCGSCWAVTSAVVLSAHAEINGQRRSFSAQELVDCVPNPKHCGGKGGCSGATVELAMSYVT
ncbi:CEP1 [Symbiodinium pilosum]|uniref:CEP1 protein n=1 Tax=Symbiodinium pilosum TaxID=2952 RepID=A0A812VUC3_SYMPI|nr:CEP1 [Symbiodinium pilosum]